MAVVVAGEDYRITVLTERLLRLEYAADGAFADGPTQVVVGREFPPLPADAAHVVRRGAAVEVRTGALHLRYDGGPFRPGGLRVDVRGGVSHYRSVWQFGDRPRTLGGTVRTLDGVDGRAELDPGVCSREGVAVLDDSRSLLLEADGTPRPRPEGHLDVYLFAHGRDYRGALADFHALTGPVPRVPRWVLGVWWSRYHAYSADDYLALLDRLAAEGVPLSVAVLDMDWHVTDVDPRLSSGWTGYTWNHALFPDPPAFLAELHARGLRVTLNDHPADGVRAHEKAYPAMARALGVDPDSCVVLPFDADDAAYLDALFAHVLRPLEQDGVDFWWLDWQQGALARTPGLDPLWVLNRRYYAESARRGRRPIAFSRYAGPGSHRTPVGFSGDTVVSWASLRFQPEFTATAANIGYGWWSHDIGGHWQGARDDELTARWVQLGVFSPVLRLHASSSPFMGKEPWRYRPEVAAVMRDALRWRHRLVPYLATMAERAAVRHRPLVEPVYHEHPWVEAAYAVPTQFRFGSELLVSPVVAPIDPGALVAPADVWLPPGLWYDLQTSWRYAGDRTLRVWRELAGVPVFAPAGAVVPLLPDHLVGNGTPLPPELEVRVFAGADGSLELHEDDDGPDSTVRAVRTPVQWRWDAREVVVGPADAALDLLPGTRSWQVVVVGAGWDWAATAEVDGRPVPCAVSDGAVHVSEVPVAARLVVRLAGARLVADDVQRAVFDYLDRVQAGFAVKDAAFAAVCRAARGLGGPTAAVPELAALGLGEAVLGRLVELLTAGAGAPG